MDKVQLSDLRVNEGNPRRIKGEKFRKLKTSIKEFPKMMSMRPIIVDENNLILAGNQRYAALLDMGYSEVPGEWVKRFDDLTEDQKREFMVKDNVSAGDWDWDMMVEIDTGMLVEWGMDMPKNLDEIKETKDVPDKGSVEFAEELLLEHNYVVLYFDNPMDWEVAKEKFRLKVVKTNIPKGSQRMGIGRVVNGRDFI